MIVWGGLPLTSSGGLYCATPSCTVRTWYTDADGDGYGNSRDGVLACSQPADHVLGGGDCNDTDPFAFPGAAERCNAADDDCDGTIDEEASAPGPTVGLR